MPNRFVTLAACLFATAIAACASSGNQTETTAGGGGGCALRQQDSTFALAGPVYRDCAVKTKAYLLTKDIRPDFHPSVKNGNCYSAELEYVVNEVGAVETKTVRVVKTNSQEFADALISILPQWKFEPAKLNDVPVRQIVADKQSVQLMVVVAPAGSRPTSPPRGARTSPAC